MSIDIIFVFFLFEFINVKGEWYLEKIVSSIITGVILVVVSDEYQSKKPV